MVTPFTVFATRSPRPLQLNSVAKVPLRLGAYMLAVDKVANEGASPRQTTIKLSPLAGIQPPARIYPNGWPLIVSSATSP